MNLGPDNQPYLILCYVSNWKEIIKCSNLISENSRRYFNSTKINEKTPFIKNTSENINVNKVNRDEPTNKNPRLVQINLL